ncbi:hypothetical protein NWE46_12465 [Escherichia coli]|nr:hypothetical protein [Escherichia coli]
MFWICSLTVITPNVLRITAKTTRWRMTSQERLAEPKGAAFGNPPYSRASQHEGQYIAGMRYIMKHASAMRDKGGRYIFLIKAATSEVWWRKVWTCALFAGVLVFELPAWFIPKDEAGCRQAFLRWCYCCFSTRHGRDQKQSATSGATNRAW